jgi:hypothetical protein
VNNISKEQGGAFGLLIFVILGTLLRDLGDVVEFVVRDLGDVVEFVELIW